jgi:glycosyltransferase involved in cell wall biosynthesis
LVRDGHECAIVASTFNYSSGKRAVEGNGLVIEQDIDGIQVLRAYTYPSLHRSFTWRVVALLSFMFSSVWAALRVKRVDLVMGTSPPLFQAISAWFVSVVRRRPLLLEIRDLWPEFAVDIGVLTNPVLIKIASWVEIFLYRHATHLLVNSPAYRDYLLGKGVPDEKISVIPNGVDPDMFPLGVDGTPIREEFGLQGKFVVTYAGALGMANDLDTLLRAAGRLRDDPRFTFLIVGEGKDRAHLESRVAELKLNNVTFTGSRNKSEMPAILAATDACVATLLNIPMFRTTYPNKVFDYMAAERPTLLAIDGVIRKVVEDGDGGLFVQPGDDAALAAAALTLCDDPERARAMGRSARRHVEQYFNRHRQAEDFVRLVSRLAHGAENYESQSAVQEVRQTSA